MSDIEPIVAEGAPPASSAYSQGLRVGNLLISSGFLGTAPDGSGIVPGGFAAEARRALDNIKAVFDAAGVGLDRVVRVNVSLTDVGRFAEMDAIYRDYFRPPYPTRNTIGVKELWGGAQVGFDVWAVIDD